MTRSTTGPNPFAAALRQRRAARRRSKDPDVRRVSTQTAIAEAIDVSQATVSGWERGADFPKPSKLDRVAKAYDLPVARVRALWMEASAATGKAA